MSVHNEKQDSTLLLGAPDSEDLRKELEILLTTTERIAAAVTAGTRGATQTSPDDSQKTSGNDLDGAVSSEAKSSVRDRYGRRKTEKEEDAELLLAHNALESDATDMVLSQPACVVNGSLKGYQIKAINWLYQLYKVGANGLLADEMGLGKTIEIIAFLGFMRHSHGLRPSMVVCPRSTLENWEREFQRWCPSLKVFKFWGDKTERHSMMDAMKKDGTSSHEVDPGVGAGEVGEDGEEQLFDICLTTFEMVLREKGGLSHKNHKWKFIVIDEAHRIKNEKSMLSQLVRCISTKNRILVTGTPLQNNLRELWSLLNFLMPELFSNADRFEALFDFSNSVDEISQSRMVSRLHSILRPLVLRRLKRDVESAIPPKHELYVFVGMSSSQKQLYANILTKNIEALNALSKASTYNMLNILMQLRKCCNHPYLFDGVEKKNSVTGEYQCGPHLVEAAGKMALLDKLLVKLKAEGSRVLIFSQMTRLLDILDDYLNWQGYAYCRIDGSTEGLERQKQIDIFNAEGSEKFVFLLSTRAGGQGINLATADVVILYDSDFNPQMDLQAIDRAHRIGQKKSVRVLRLVTEGTVEERIVERAARKLKIDAIITQKGRLSQAVASVAPTGDELRDMISFGAQEVYTTRNSSSVSVDDVEAILKSAEERTKDIEARLSTLESKFDLSSLSLDGGLKMFEDISTALEGCGVDGSIASDGSAPISATTSTGDRLTSSSNGLQFLDLGERSTKWKGSTAPYVGRKITKKPPLSGWRKEANGGHDFQFFNSARLDALEKIEVASTKGKAEPSEEHEEVSTGKNAASKDEGEEKPEEFTKEMQKEKERLLAEGFAKWTRSDFNRLIQAMEEYGVMSVDRRLVSAIPSKSKEDIEDYLKVFKKRFGEMKDGSSLMSRIKKAVKIKEEEKKRSDSLMKMIRSGLQPRIESSSHKSEKQPSGSSESTEDPTAVSFDWDRQRRPVSSIADSIVLPKSPSAGGGTSLWGDGVWRNGDDVTLEELDKCILLAMSIFGANAMEDILSFVRHLQPTTSSSPSLSDLLMGTLSLEAVRERVQKLASLMSTQSETLKHKGHSNPADEETVVKRAKLLTTT